MSSAKSPANQEFENDSHIAKKKKALEAQSQKKNFKRIVELFDDDDIEYVEKYARYIK